MNKTLVRLLLTTGAVMTLTLGVAMDASAATRGESAAKNLEQPSLFNESEKSIGVGYLGTWAGGVDFTGSYFFTKNIALQADIAMMSYSFAPGSSASFTYFDVMGVYHMAFSDNLGWFAGLGLATGSASLTGFPTVTVSGLAYEFGGEMFFAQNMRGHLGILSGGINLGLDMSF